MTRYTSGETIKVCRSAAPCSAITAVFAGASKHTVAATASQDGWFEIIADTSGWAAGNYLMEVMQATDSEKKVILRETFVLQQAAGDIPVGAEVRSEAEIAVANLKAMLGLGGAATPMVRRYRINNRELENYPIADLRALLAEWRGILAEERRRANGGRAPRIVFTV